MKRNLKPSNNTTIQEIANAVWSEFWKKYRMYNNGDADQSKHFTDQVWTQALDDIDALYQKYPSEVTTGLCMVYLMELQARDRGGYIEAEQGWSKQMFGLIKDVNPNEISGHIADGTLSEWCGKWQQEAKDAMHYALKYEGNDECN